jgi:type I restriction-modification system DNA methylase subunit
LINLFSRDSGTDTGANPEDPDEYKALPGQLFYSTQIPVCLWFLVKNKKDPKRRQRCGEPLFVDARKMGTLTYRVHRELTPPFVPSVPSVP